MDYTLRKLKNGLRVILVPMKNTQAVTVLVKVGTGSKYETKKFNGISHFMEHLLFKGTKKRPNPFEITKLLDGIGAEFNAFTGKETTGYYIKAPANYLKTALDVLSDIYLNSVFDEREMEKEKGVIIEEINMYRDIPQRYVGVLFEKLLYGDQPAGWDIAGEKENILKMKRNDIVNYLNNNYCAKNTVICIAGSFNEKNILNEVNSYFGKIKNTAIPKKKKVIEKQSGPNVLLQFKETDQAYLVFGLRAFSGFDERRFALELVATAIGGNMSSRLFRRLRDDLGISYYVSTDQENYTDSGYLSTSSGLNVNKLDVGLKEIIKAHKEIITNIKEREIKMAKEFLKGKLLLDLEDSCDVAMFFAQQEIIYNKILRPEELFKKLDEVSLADAKTVIKEIFTLKKMNLAIIGPYKDKKRFDSLLKI